MKGWGNILTAAILLIAQTIIWNYFNLSQFVLLTFLPAMILCLPVRIGTVRALLLSFLMGFAVDFFASGVLGLTCAALLPVALCRRFIITIVYGEEMFARGENISFRRQGPFKMNLAVVIATAIFLIVYIWIDGAGMRPFWFNLVRFLSSLAVSSLCSLFIASLLTEDNNARWR